MATWAPSQPSQHLQYNFIAFEFAVKSFDFSIWPMKQYSCICPFGKLSTGDQIPKAGKKGLLAFHVLCRDSCWGHPNLKIGSCLPVMYHFINVSKWGKAKKKKKENLDSVLLFSFFSHALQARKIWGKTTSQVFVSASCDVLTSSSLRKKPYLSLWFDQIGIDSWCFFLYTQVYAYSVGLPLFLNVLRVSGRPSQSRAVEQGFEVWCLLRPGRWEEGRHFR